MGLGILEESPNGHIDDLMIGIFAVAIPWTAIHTVICFYCVYSDVAEVLDIWSGLKDYVSTVATVSSIRTGVLIGPQAKEWYAAVASFAAYCSKVSLVYKVADLEGRTAVR